MATNTEGLIRRKSLGGRGFGGGTEADSSPDSRPLLSMTPGRGTDKAGKSTMFDELLARDDFSKNRWRCIWNTKRAVHTLTHWAKLDITIDEATDLAPPDSSAMKFGETTGNYGVQVLLDGVFVFDTSRSVRSKNPVWREEGHINVHANNSFIRLHVYHDGGAGVDPCDIGFVEFNVQDLPIDKVIEGVFELRFAENLVNNSSSRYAQHCKRRDENDQTVGDTRSDGDENDHTVIEHTSSKPRIPVSGRNMFTCCAKPEGPEEVPSKATHYLNAGSIRLRLQLKLVGSWWDMVYGLALNGNQAIEFGSNLVANAQSILATQDQAYAVKLALWDDCLLCLKNYATFIIRWRNFPLSALIYSMILFAMIVPWMQFPVLFMLIALCMQVNASTTERTRMSLSGDNAPLTQEGFELVASIRSTKNMTAFLTRVVEHSLGSTVSNQPNFSLLATRCFRDGATVMKLEALKEELKKSDWIKQGKPLEKGSPILVDEHFRGIIEGLHPGDLVAVKYENGMLPNKVDRSQVMLRPSMPIPDWLIPEAIDHKIRRVRVHLNMCTYKIMPLLVEVRAVVTWEDKYRKVSRGVTWGLVAMAIFFALVRQYWRICGMGTHISPFQAWLKHTLQFPCGNPEHWKFLLTGDGRILGFFIGLILQRGFVIIIGVLVAVKLMDQAEFLVPAKSLARICKRLLCNKRTAPKKWAFFEETLVGEIPTV